MPRLLDSPHPSRSPGADARAARDAELDAELRALERSGLLRSMRRVRRLGGARIDIDGREALDFASNDYLGLAADPRIAEAAAAALHSEGTGAGAARLITGNHPLHEALESELAALKGTEAALLFPTGYMANVGTIPAIAGAGDAIYSDALNHASLIDGCRLSRAAVRVVPHADADAMDAALARDEGRVGRRLIVVEGVFSMDGDRAPLRALADIAGRRSAWLVVDDAHGTGVLGPGGAGAAAAAGVAGAPAATIGTLGKAFGGAGAFVAGSRALIALLRQRARAFVFTTGSPPALAAATLAALRIAAAEPWRRARVAECARALRTALAEAGRPAPGPPDGAIVPVVVGDPRLTMRIAAALLERGFAVGAVRPPTVPAGTSRLRLTCSAAQSPDEARALAGAIADLLPPHA